MNPVGLATALIALARDAGATDADVADMQIAVDHVTGPYDLPPGPARRTELLEEGHNVRLADFTPAELAALDVDEADLDWKPIRRLP